MQCLRTGGVVFFERYGAARFRCRRVANEAVGEREELDRMIQGGVLAAEKRAGEIGSIGE